MLLVNAKFRRFSAELFSVAEELQTLARCSIWSVPRTWTHWEPVVSYLLQRELVLILQQVPQLTTRCHEETPVCPSSPDFGSASPLWPSGCGQCFVHRRRSWSVEASFRVNLNHTLDSDRFSSRPCQNVDQVYPLYHTFPEGQAADGPRNPYVREAGPQPMSPAHLSVCHRLRKVIQELVDTEKSYVKVGSRSIHL